MGRLQISAAALIVGLLASTASTASAQTAPAEIELTSEQLDLNNKAIRALSESPPDVERALRLVSAADMVGEPNQLIGLTKARTFQLAGRCTEASELYSELESLPGVKGVPTDALVDRISRYEAELDDCFANLVLSCERPSITAVEVDGIKNAKCGSSHKVDPGELALWVTIGELEPRRDLIALEPGMSRLYEVSAPEGFEKAAAVSEAASRVRIGAARGEMVAAETAPPKPAPTGQPEPVQAASPQPPPDHRGGGAADPADSTATDSPSARAAAATPNIAPARETGPIGSQVQVAFPAGAFSVRKADGLADGGFTYGLRFGGMAGWSFTKGLAADLRLLFEYRQGSGMGAYVDPVDERAFIFDLEPRLWADFLAFGLSLQQRTERLRRDDSTDASGRIAGGLTVAISSRGVRRGDGFFEVYGRWLPLFGGSRGTFETGIRSAGRYATFDVGYSLFRADDTSGKFRQAEAILVSLGIKVPILSPVLEAERRRRSYARRTK